MPEFLVFQLYGPLAAWGDIAVGERRGSWSRPSKSAVVGLLGAALGMPREDRTLLSALTEGYGMAVRVDAPGQPLRDYHTAQTVAQATMRRLSKADPRPLTRRRQMATADRETILSQRDYYTDAHYTTALWARGGAPHPLQRLADALRQPCFPLSLGRKSCPPSLPLWPQVIEAADVAEALAAYAPPALRALGGAVDAVLRKSGDVRLLAWEDNAVPASSARVQPLQRERRRDVPIDRQRWQFAERAEQVGAWIEAP